MFLWLQENNHILAAAAIKNSQGVAAQGSSYNGKIGES